MLTTARKKILVFLFLTFAFSSIFYYLILSSGSLHPYSFGIMWCPGLAAILTQLIFQRSLRGLGWQAGKPKYWLWSYGLPILYGAVVYGIVWLTGLGRLVPFERVYQAAEQMNIEVRSPVIFLIVYILGMGTIGVIVNMTSALGEEIGWRGFLVPELYREFSFAKTALISGIIWAVWHSPVILFADYNNTGVSTWYGLTCFAVMVIGMSFAFAWLRLKSGSLWTAVILHGSHNLFIQGIFTPFTGNTGLTPYVIDEFGVGLALAAIVVAYLFWRKRDVLPERNTM
jgi:membrane protease YdiL (CAAX protease family)